MDLPKISIVTPSFNQGQFLQETIESVLSQNYGNLEYIIIDGGSTDNSVDIIKKYEKHLKYWVSEKDKGQSDGINKGFKMCTGNIFAWLNSDDLYEPDTLNTVADFFMSHKGCQVLYGDAKWIDSESRFIKNKKEMFFSKLIYIYDHNYIPQPSTFFSKEIFNRSGGLDMDLHYTMDMDLWLKFAGLDKIYHIRKYLSRMRYYDDQKMIKGRKDADIEGDMVIERHIGRRLGGAEKKLLHPLAKAVRFALKQF